MKSITNKAYMNHSKSGARFLLLAICTLFTSIAAKSEILTWNGSRGSSWTDTRNWTPNGAPSTTSDITIPSGLATYPSITSSGTFSSVVIELGANLHIQSAGNIFVSVLEIKAGANLKNDGILVTNSLINNGTFTQLATASSTVNNSWSGSGSNPTLGTVSLTADNTAQIIPAGYYSTLTINGSNTKQLNGNVTVKDLAFTSSSNSILQGNGHTLALTGTISGETSNSHYSGKLTRTETINSAKNFTFGGIGVDFKSSGNSNWGDVTVTRITGAAAQNPKNQSLTGISRQWHIAPQNAAGVKVDLKLTWLKADDNGKTFSNGAGYFWKSLDNGNTWVFVGEVTGLDLTKDTRTLTVSTTSFSTWTVSDISSPLPVTWLSFNAARTTAGTALSWSTASENNSSRFAIERSTDGKTFTTIAEVAAAGNSENTRNYSFTDAQAPATTAYYRLQQFDQNGEYTYSKIIAVDGRKQLALATEVFPNPLREELHLKLAQPLTSPATAELQDLTGRTLSRFSLTNNTASQTLQLPALAQGIYLLRLTIENQVQVIKLMKE